MNTDFLPQTLEAACPSTLETRAPTPNRAKSQAQTLDNPAANLSRAPAAARPPRLPVRPASCRLALASLALAALLALTGCAKPNDAAADAPNPRAADLAQCARHHAPLALCFICDPARREPSRLWCSEHARYEDRCWLCHPEARDPKRPFCQTHGLYEDECFLCRPELKPTPGARRSEAPNTTPDPPLQCREHGVPEAECGICHPDRVGRLRPGESVKVRLPTAASAGVVGVQTAPAQVGGLTEGIECFAELAFDQNRLAHIVAPAGGIVQDVAADLGSRVEEHQVVARIWSAAIAEAVARAVLTHQTLERERRLRAERVSAEQDLQRAEAEHRAACQHARTLGFSEADIDAFGTRPDEPVYLEVRAPFAGEIIERNAVRGAWVEAGRALFTLADRSTMWAMLNIPEAALGRVRPGQTVELTFDSIPGRTFTGALTWIAPEVDERTRLARARAEVPNPDGLLRARMFARARILTRQAAGALMLPASAIQRVDGQPVVFVRLADDLFAARAVRLGAKRGDQVEVEEGLSAPEQVAVAGSFALKSHLLLSRLGAGCAEE